MVQAAGSANLCAFDSYSKRPYPGYVIEAAFIVCKYLNINCTFHWYNGTEYSDYNFITGAVTGLISAIYRGEFDTTVPILSPTYSRVKPFLL